MWFQCWFWLNSWTSCYTQLGWHHLSLLTGASPGQLFPLPSGTTITASKLLAPFRSAPLSVYLPLWTVLPMIALIHCFMLRHRVCKVWQHTELLPYTVFLKHCSSFQACIPYVWPQFVSYFGSFRSSWVAGGIVFHTFLCSLRRWGWLIDSCWDCRYLWQEFRGVLGCLLETTPNGTNYSDFHQQELQKQCGCTELGVHGKK